MHLLRLMAFAALCLLILGSTTPVQALEKPTRGKVEQKAPKTEPMIAGEEPGDRARRLLDLQTERLERDARRTMQTICRGC